MKTAVVYARYSSEKQNEQSIEGQLRVCQEYADRNDIKIVKTYIDRAMSGTNDNRASFQKMLKDSNKRVWDYVIVYKLDRFSRNKYEAAIHRKTLRDNNVKILSAMENIPDSPEGIILESLLEGMSEYYSAELSQKVKRGMHESRLKGHWGGGQKIFGYDIKDKRPVINKAEAEVVKRIFDEYLSGKLVTEIRKTLTDEGVLLRKQPFCKTTLYNVLRNEKYIGITRFGNEVFTNIYPAILPKETFMQAKEKMAKNHYGRHPKEPYLLKGKVKCGYCHNNMNAESGIQPNGELRRYYKCATRKSRKGCIKDSIRKDTLEKIVVDATLQLFEDDEQLEELANKILEKHNQRTQESAALDKLLQQKEKIEKAITNLYDFLKEGFATEMTKKEIKGSTEKLQDIETKIAVVRSMLQTTITKEDIIKYLRTTLKKTPQAIVDTLIKEVVIDNEKIEIYYNYIESDLRNDTAPCILLSEKEYSTNIEYASKSNCDNNQTFEVKAYA